MFSFFKNKSNKYSDKSIGMQKYNQLKELLLDKEVLSTLILNASGIHQAPLSVALEVNTAVGLVNYLSNLTGISGMELVDAITEQKYDRKISLIIIDQEHSENYEINKNDSWMDVLIQWADDNNLKELQDHDAFAYKQTGFPRNKNQFLSMDCLHIPDSNISYLPAELGNLKRLNKICLRGNSINKYPKEMCNYKSLILLDLDNNNIFNLPKEIGNLTSLQKLYLENNSINNFPIEMKKLINLKKLDIRGIPIHLSSKYSPLSEEELEMYAYFNYELDVIREDSIQRWLDKTDTSTLTMTYG